MSTHPLPAACPNCTEPVLGPYCVACGQETIIETPTVMEFVHETLHHYVAAEGKIWRTLWLLVGVPGALTRDYLEGRRKRYIRPVQLYLTLSFVFFLLAGLSGALTAIPGSVKVEHNVDEAGRAISLDPEVKAQISQIQSDPEAQASVEQVRKGLATLADVWQERVKAADGDASKALGKVFENALHRVPIALFILMPLLAVILNLLYIGRKLPYGAHLLFAIHLHAFFFALLIVSLIPFPDAVQAPLWILAPSLYLLLALHRVYGGRWWPQILRTAVVGCLYGSIVGLGLLILIGASFFF